MFVSLGEGMGWSSVMGCWVPELRRRWGVSHLGDWGTIMEASVCGEGLKGAGAICYLFRCSVERGTVTKKEEL